MEQKTLKGFNRETLKKGASSRLRREGKIPAIIYGRNEPKAVAVEMREFNKKFHSVSENTIISIDIEGEKRDVIVKDYQDNPMTGIIQHIDFYEIEKGKLLKTHVPIVCEGTSPGVKEGGILDITLHELEVECLPKDMPEQITVDISKLGLGAVFHIADLNVVEGIKILNNSDDVIVSVLTKGSDAASVETETEEETEEEA